MKAKTLLIVMVALLSATHVWAQYNFVVEFSGSKLYYKVVPGGVEVVRYHDLDSNGVDHYQDHLAATIMIPEQISDVKSVATGEDTTYQVVGIGDSAFQSCPIKNAKMPSGLKYIGYMAFRGCNKLKSIELSDDLMEVKNYAFSESGLTMVVFPSSVSLMGEHVFANCSSLTSVVLPSSIVEIAKSAFENTGLTEISIGDEVKKIKNAAFKGCNKLVKLRLGNKVETIAEEAFAYCPIDSLVLPSTMKEIKPRAFFNSGITSIDFGTSACAIRVHSFEYCQKLTSLVIPKGIIDIEGGAFAGCMNLSSISVDEDNPQYNSNNKCNGIVFTGTGTLVQGCSKTVFTNEIKAIGDHAMEGCFFMDPVNVYLSDSIVSIGDYAFANCYFINLKMPSQLKHLGVAAFAHVSVYNVDSMFIWNLYLPDSLAVISDSAFAGCYINTVNIPPSVRKIGDRAFYRATVLNTVKGCEGVKRVGDEAFSNCFKLTSISLNNVDTLENEVFLDCSSLPRITLPESLWMIGVSVFEKCKLLDTIFIERKAPAFLLGDLTIPYKTVVMVPCGTYYDYQTIWGMWGVNLKNMKEVEPAPYKVTTYVDSDEHGSAEVVPQGFHHLGCDTTAILLAKPKKGWLFARWNNSSRKNPDTIKVSHNMEVLATFVEDVTPEICKVDVDDEMHPVLYWNQLQEVNCFFIYQLDTASGKLKRIDTLFYNNTVGPHNWVDTTADVSESSYSYAVQSLGTNSIESNITASQSTLHVQLQEIVGYRELSWKGYVGKNMRAYYIYRGPTPDSMQYIGVIQSSPKQGQQYEFVDKTQAQGPMYYRVAGELVKRCSSGDGTEYTWSNLLFYVPTGIDETEISAPRVSLYTEGGRIIVVGAENHAVAVYDMMGRKVASSVPTQVLPQGVYMVKIDGYSALKAVVM